MQFPNARLLIFAKLPVPGRVKTRLVPLLGERSAAAFHAACLVFTLQRRMASQIAPLQLWLAPGIDARWKAFAGELGVEVYAQQGEDLGARMAFAATQALSEAESVLLTGADAPELGNDSVREAAAALHSTNGSCMIPAHDGGYVLLGLRSLLPQLFEDMPWGTSEVAALTRQRTHLREFAPQHDIDRPEDLVRLAGVEGLAAQVQQWDQAAWLEWLQQRIAPLSTYPG